MSSYDIFNGITYTFNDASLFFDCIDRNICGANLLCNTAGFTVLNVRTTQLVQNFRFASVDMT